MVQTQFAINNPFQQGINQKDVPTYIDLTQQFMKIANNSSSFQLPKPVNNNPNKEFFEQSAVIKKRLEITEERLNEFNKQQRKQGLFDNDEGKLNELLGLIKDNIDFVQKGFNKLASQQQNTSGYTNFQLRKTIVEIIQAQFIDQTQNFKKSIQNRSAILTQNHQKINKISKPQNDGVSRRPAFKNRKQQQQQEEFNNKSLDYDIEGGGEQESMLKNDNRYYQQRKNQMSNISEKLKEIGGMFQTLASKVKLQDIIIERIDKDTESSLNNVQKSKKNLLDAKKKAESTRALMLKIFLILLVFATFYIVFLL
ncbi:t-SNARE [Pseudocohnilembus persalinus]|uniref:t-SNARE n=1 Tax=Pseudocohnilembus persalinus TaxID=266149 RepID=A0A0V0QIL4_PSEPJ|nr:t-SNARE [Pseudocohnilembus persalinus]|eukprot:KRX02082.1 t-SNARE [Pseudocohnilembus persalinus]